MGRSASLRHHAAAMRHQITELFDQSHDSLDCMGATMEDDMVADAILWVLFAAAIALVTCGCRMTRQTPKVAKDAAGLPGALDRAA